MDVFKGHLRLDSEIKVLENYENYLNRDPKITLLFGSMNAQKV
jgi:hypothetical protein